ncbi:MAG: hypothetical protein IT209_08030 [Armatimonadetes bacterium]|nr:hypothetical protein [Armatimonadota bacterium]
MSHHYGCHLWNGNNSLLRNWVRQLQKPLVSAPVRFVSTDGGVMNHEGRLAIVRLYERLTGVRLLKPEIV